MRTLIKNASIAKNKVSQHQSLQEDTSNKTPTNIIIEKIQVFIMTTNPELDSRDILLDQFRETRSRTLELVKTLEKDDFVVQTAFFMSPPKWHIGHVSWIYEAIMSKIDKNYEFYSKEFSEYLNSYYQQFGVPHDKGLRGVISRPTTDQIFQYFNTTNQRVEKFIESQTSE